MTSRREFVLGAATATFAGGLFGSRRPASGRDDGSDEGTVNVKDFGAVGDGSTDDTDAVQAALEASDQVFLPSGRYRITRPIIVGARKRISGENGSLYTLARTELRARSDEIGDGEPIFRLNPDDQTNVQDVLIERLHFRGDNDTISFRTLHEGEDAGPVGIDATHVKDHIVIRDCSFRDLRRGIGQREMQAYTGQVYIDNCHFVTCYRAVDLTTSTHLSLSQCDVRECVDWIDVSAASVLNCAFNNSSFAREHTGLKASRQLVVVGTWFEGGNHAIEMTRDGCNVTLVNSYLGAAHSARGNTKYHVALRPGWFLATGNYGVQYTRTFDFPNAPVPDAERYVIRLMGNNFEEPIRFKFSGYDPDALGFDYFGDEDFDTRGKTRTSVVDRVPGGESRQVEIAPLDGAYRYAVEITGAALDRPEPRIIQEDRLLVLPGADDVHVSSALRDNAAADARYHAGDGRVTLEFRNGADVELRRVAVRITALGSPFADRRA